MYQKINTLLLLHCLFQLKSCQAFQSHGFQPHSYGLLKRAQAGVTLAHQRTPRNPGAAFTRPHPHPRPRLEHNKQIMIRSGVRKHNLNPASIRMPASFVTNILQMSAETGDASSPTSSGILASIMQTSIKTFCKFAPLWTLMAAALSIQHSSAIAPTIGSLYVMQKALAVLMLAMGLTVTPKDFSRAMQQPSIVILNGILCFGMMPLLALFIANILSFDPSRTAGIVSLGCVSGGQASNLFALLAGGDVALSVVCTLSTTLLGVIATPLLIKRLLQCVVVVDGMGVLRSVASLVLVPLLTGLGLGRFAPRLVQRLEPFCPLVGVFATLLLVAGGASNSASILVAGDVGRLGVIAASCLLPVLGGGLALLLSYFSMGTVGRKSTRKEEKSRRTLVVETLSKSPTLAYVLAQKHFGQSAASIPAAGMVSLAVIGAIVATLWSIVDPIDQYEDEVL
jgi:BASS family bile acid:Na+ symporter